APFVAMTILQMAQFGQPEPVGEGSRITVKAGAAYEVPANRYPVEADATAASYFVALPVVTGGALDIPGYKLDGLQGDVRFGRLLESSGLIGPLDLSTSTQRISRGHALNGIDADFNEFSD